MTEEDQATVLIDQGELEAAIPGGVEKEQVVAIATSQICVARGVSLGHRYNRIQKKVAQIVVDINHPTILYSLCSVFSHPSNDLEKMLDEFYELVKPDGSLLHLEWVDHAAGVIVKIDRNRLM